MGQNEKYDIPALVEDIETKKGNIERIRVAAIREVETFHSVRSGNDRTRCFIKVQDGCNYFCTYCTNR